MATTAHSGMTCPNCGTPIQIKGFEQLDEYLKRGWALIAVPAEIAERIEGRAVTHYSAAEISGWIKAYDAQRAAERADDVGVSLEHAPSIGLADGGVPGYRVKCSCGNFHEWIQGTDRKARNKAQMAAVNHLRRMMDGS